MQIIVHDVGHGSCISLIHDGNVMLWDCGHSEKNRPSDFLCNKGIGKIDTLFITNYDEDHISDLPNLQSKFSLSTLVRNESISVEQLSRLKCKSGPISRAMKAMLDMITTYTKPVSMPSASTFPGISYKTFCNPYGMEFDDTNNISLVTFLHFGRNCLIIPGDLETAGWRKLLERDDFKKELGTVNYFIASHHGRENGYCEEVFDFCNPEVVIFSDDAIQHATQEMASIYADHASGIPFNDEERYVLSTRKDGSILLN